MSTTRSKASVASSVGESFEEELKKQPVDKYEFLKKLGEGSFGVLYKGITSIHLLYCTVLRAGRNIEDDELVAIKLERIENNRTPSLRIEYSRYKRLSNAEGIPKVNTSCYLRNEHSTFV